MGIEPLPCLPEDLFGISVGRLSLITFSSKSVCNSMSLYLLLEVEVVGIVGRLYHVLSGYASFYNIDVALYACLVDGRGFFELLAVVAVSK